MVISDGDSVASQGTQVVPTRLTSTTANSRYGVIVPSLEYEWLPGTEAVLMDFDGQNVLTANITRVCDVFRDIPRGTLIADIFPFVERYYSLLRSDPASRKVPDVVHHGPGIVAALAAFMAGTDVPNPSVKRTMLHTSEPPAQPSRGPPDEEAPETSLPAPQVIGDTHVEDDWTFAAEGGKPDQTQHRIGRWIGMRTRFAASHGTWPHCRST